MKKFIALALALTLVLTASVAFAAGSPSPKPKALALNTSYVSVVRNMDVWKTDITDLIAFYYGSNAKALEIASVADFSDDAKAAIKTGFNVDDEKLANYKIVTTYTLKLLRRGVKTVTNIQITNDVKVLIAAERFQGYKVKGFLIADQATGAAQFVKEGASVVLTLGTVYEVYVLGL